MHECDLTNGIVFEDKSSWEHKHGQLFLLPVKGELQEVEACPDSSPVFYERNGKVLRLKTKSFCRVENGENILFL